MSTRVVRLPDVGEGVAEAELVMWHVAVGDTVSSDTIVAEVLTDKATVEIYSPAAGTIEFTRGDPGDVLAVGSELFGVAMPGDAAVQPVVDAVVEPMVVPVVIDRPVDTPPPSVASEPRAARVAAAPAVRARARELGIDLARVPAPSGHVTHADLDRHLLRGVQRTAAPNGTAAQNTELDTTAVPIIGLRRRIAERMVTSLRIPHITYVEEVDVTALVHLRETLSSRSADAPRLTLLPFVARALVIAVAEHPNCNATFADDVEPQLLNTHAAAHIGIATNTPSGLVVPVVRDAQSFGLWGLAAEVNRVTTAARDGSAGRNELSGSTITITSLGALGGLVTTPIINAPEVAIVGINKIHVRPMWDGSAFAPRRMMNMSSSFDHRIVDGWNAAVFVQRIKALLEEPALLFIDAPRD